MNTLFITGPLGAGKTTASALAAHACEATGTPATTIALDVIGHEVLDRPDVRNELVARFGAAVLDEAGKVDRTALARAAFATKASTRSLNRVTHAAIAREAVARRDGFLAEHPGGLVVIEAPFPRSYLLTNESMHTLLDDARTIVITADAERRFRRQAALGMTHVHERMDAQDAMGVYQGEYVIQNDGSLAALETAVTQVVAVLLEGKHTR